MLLSMPTVKPSNSTHTNNRQMPKNNQLYIFQHNNKHITGSIHRIMHETLKQLLGPNDGRPANKCWKKANNGYSIEKWKIKKTHKITYEIYLKHCCGHHNNHIDQKNENEGSINVGRFLEKSVSISLISFNKSD